VQVHNLSNIIAVSAGGFHSLALDSEGNVYAWGHNYWGQLGDDTVVRREEPVHVLTDVRKIAAGTLHSVAIKNDYTVWAWGSNWSGQLGNEIDEDKKWDETPKQVPAFGNVEAIAAGRAHTVALKQDKTVWTWGSGNEGQLGVAYIPNLNPGDDEISDTPLPVNLTDVTAIAASEYSTFAVRSDKTARAWGDNNDGQLGDGTTTTRRTPVQIVNHYNNAYQNLTEISSLFYHTLAITSDGYVVSWGYNWEGQLGNGTASIYNPHPSFVHNLDDVAAIATTAEGSFALKNDGTVWAWGANWDEFLGVDATGNQLLPMQVVGENGNGFLNLGTYVSAPVSRNWTATVNGFGTLVVNSDSALPGETITLTLNARPDYRLTNLTVSGDGVVTLGTPGLTTRTVQFNMPVGSGDLAVTVTPTWVYVPPPSYNVNAIINITNSGTVTRSHATAPAGTVITLTANPNNDFRFIRWEVSSGGPIAFSSATNSITTFVMPNNAVTVRAVFENRVRTGTRTVDFSGQMSLTLPRQSSNRSSSVTANVTNLPADAAIISISVNVRRNVSGSGIMPSSVFVRNSHRTLELQMPWMGLQDNPLVNNTAFWNYPANALWEISWFGTNLSALQETRIFGDVRLIIEYVYRI
jgi:hypothetical protein